MSTGKLFQHHRPGFLHRHSSSSTGSTTIDKLKHLSLKDDPSMTSAAPVTDATSAGGGAALASQQTVPLKVTSGPLLEQIKLIYTSLIGNDSHLSTSEFRDFLLTVQHEHPPEPTGVLPWVSSFFTGPSAQNLLVDESPITFDDFMSFMCSPHNNALQLRQNTNYSLPMTSYFISSSHNTYLVGNQLYGESTTKGYINVLQRGCRCIEIDVYDGESGEPEVLHGWTLTKEISFRDVCTAIGQHAWDVTDLPLIVSLEVHAGLTQQAVMVNIMRETWGSMLVEDYVAGDPTKGGNLPCPDDLRRRILIKVKHRPSDDSSTISTSTESPLSRTTTRSSRSSSSPSSSDNEDQDASIIAKKKTPKAKLGLPLASLGLYIVGYTFKSSFRDPAALAPAHIFSISERRFTSLLETHSSDIFTHNKSHFMRIFPKGLRINSSNYNPSLFWANGVQVVALNWQKVDTGMMLNEGMFGGGELGYVLKPISHLPNKTGSGSETYENPGVGNVNLMKVLDLKITILAGQNLPLPEGEGKGHKFEPYVKVDLHPTGRDALKEKTKTRKGVDVEWEKGKGAVAFIGVLDVVDSLSFVRIRVFDNEFGHDDLTAWTCIRLDRLKSGYRFLHLFDAKGRETEGVLLVKIEKVLR